MLTLVLLMQNLALYRCLAGALQYYLHSSGYFLCHSLGVSLYAWSTSWTYGLSYLTRMLIRVVVLTLVALLSAIVYFWVTISSSGLLSDNPRCVSVMLKMNLVVSPMQLRCVVFTIVELTCSISTTTLLYCDNVSVVYFFGNLVHHHRTKHIEMDIHFIH